MNEAPSVERYYSEMTGRPPILMLCAMFGGLALMLVYSVISRSSYATDDLVLLGLSVVVLIVVGLVVWNLHAPAIVLTDSEMIVRNSWKRKQYRFDRIEAMAIYSKTYHPKRVAGMSRSPGRIRPVFVDHLLIRTLTGVHELILPRFSNTQLLESLEARTGIKIRELEHSSQARKWAKGRLSENPV